MPVSGSVSRVARKSSSQVLMLCCPISSLDQIQLIVTCSSASTVEPRAVRVRFMQVIQNDFRIAKAVRLLNENSSRTLADLASGCTLSISRLSHLFKAKTGLTVGSFRRNCRFRAAMKMLATTDMPIKQVADALGYQHTSSFVRAFQLHVGVSPGDYRKCELREHGGAGAVKEQKMLTTFG